MGKHSNIVTNWFTIAKYLHLEKEVNIFQYLQNILYYGRIHRATKSEEQVQFWEFALLASKFFKNVHFCLWDNRATTCALCRYFFALHIFQTLEHCCAIRQINSAPNLYLLHQEKWDSLRYTLQNSLLLTIFNVYKTFFGPSLWSSQAFNKYIFCKKPMKYRAHKEMPQKILKTLKFVKKQGLLLLCGVFQVLYIYGIYCARVNPLSNHPIHNGTFSVPLIELKCK